MSCLIVLSIAMTLGARVGPNLKAKISANEYVDFKCLLSVTPSTERYPLSLAPSGTSSAQPQLNLEPVHAPPKIQSLNQWLTAFNNFVAIYMERYPSDAPRLMKYCKVMRDIASKPGDWLFYDYQFRYIRQSAPVSHPWDTIHWELWLRAVTNFHARPAMPVDKVSPHQTFSRGTCWAFQGGRFCGGWRFPHLCFKCGSPHLASQRRIQLPHAPPVQPGNKQSPSAHPLPISPVTPVRVDRLDFLLHWYGHDYKHFLIDGFTFGFGLGFMGDECSLESLNLKSALSQPQVVSAKLEKKRAAGRIAGPFSSPPFPYFHCSPLGIVPKKDPSEFRSIHHLFYPKGSSINDHIPQEFSSVKYACINDAISVIKSFGAGCFMANTDIKSAFCIILVHPKDHPLLGMKWDSQYFFDCTVPMGCSSSCTIFEAFSSALQWLSKHLFHALGLVHILDV